MKILKDLIENMNYINGITVINLEGEILFTAKFNNKFHDNAENYEIVGKNLKDIYINLNTSNSTLFQCILLEKPIFIRNQILELENKTTVTITSLSLPIRHSERIVGAIDLSIEESNYDGLKNYDNISSLNFTNNSMQNLNIPQSYIKYRLKDIITENIEMLKMKKFVAEICNFPIPVTIYGETGTGKELVAHSLHSESERKEKPFIVQNCSAIPENLFESIFFGSVKGAFTDAKNTQGLFELANGGTLFLDEINSMPLHLQAKLLRVIQDKRFSKLGSKEIINVNVRLIFALNKDPVIAIQNQELRSDLFYRISALKIEILPLRKRKEDIILLTKYFILKYNKLLDKHIKKISYEVYEYLKSYTWPGNVRELENTVLEILCKIPSDKEILEITDCDIDNSNLPPKEKIDSLLIEDFSLKTLVKEYEKKIIEKNLIKCNYNISKTARYLKIPRQTLQRKLKEYAIF